MSHQPAAADRPPLVGTQPRGRPPLRSLSPLGRGARQRDPFDQVERYCMFLGDPRGGPSLVGSLPDAHPDVVVAHELDAPCVLGDEQGGGSTRRLRDRPALLHRLRRTVGVPLRAVHAGTCPFDNIASMKPRRAAPLEQVVEESFGLCDAVAVLRRRLAPDELAEVRYEDLAADPRSVLRSLAGFLGVDAQPAWATAASVVDATPSRSRAKLAWPPEPVAAIGRRRGRDEFLTGYGFDT